MESKFCFGDAIYLYDSKEWIATGMAGGFQGGPYNFATDRYPIEKVVSVHEIEPEKPIILVIAYCNCPGDALRRVEFVHVLLQMTDWNVLALVEDTQEFVLRSLLKKKALKKIFIFKKEEPELKTLESWKGRGLTQGELKDAGRSFGLVSRPLQLNSKTLEKVVNEFKITHIVASGGGLPGRKNHSPLGKLKLLSWTLNDEEIQWGRTILKKKEWENEPRENLISIHPKGCGTGEGHPAAWYPELTPMGVEGRKKKSRILLETLVNEFPEKKIVLLGHFLAEGEFSLFEHERVLNCIKEACSLKQSVIMASFCDTFLGYTLAGFKDYVGLLPSMKAVLVEGDRWQYENLCSPYLKTFDKVGIVRYLEPTSDCIRIVEALRKI